VDNSDKHVAQTSSKRAGRVGSADGTSPTSHTTGANHLRKTAIVAGPASTVIASRVVRHAGRTLNAPGALRALPSPYANEKNAARSRIITALSPATLRE